MNHENVTSDGFCLFEFLHYHGLRNGGTCKFLPRTLSKVYCSSLDFLIFFAIVFRVVSKFVTDEGLFQEIIKVRERIPRIGFLLKVIPLKLFLDMVPISSTDVTRALRGCFRGGFVYVLFLLVSNRRKTFNAVRISSMIF